MPEPARGYALDRGGVARVRFTTRADGDLAVGGDPAVLESRRRAILDLPWTWMRQVHGAHVITVGERPRPGVEADAAVTRTPGSVLAVHTADCAPVALVGRGGAVAVAHAGWRGLRAGVLEATVDALRQQDAGEIVAELGPCIHVECYEFGRADLEHLVDHFGPEVAGTTDAGTPALDVPAAVRAALARRDVELAVVAPSCTSCDRAYFSHRARGESGRQAALVWIDQS